MKKIRLLLSAFGVALSVCGGFLATKAHDQVKKAEATVQNVSIQFKDYNSATNDPSTCTYRIGKEGNYTPSNGSWTLTNLGTNQYRLQYSETSSSSIFFYYTALVKIQLYMPSYSHSNVNLTFNPLATECSTGGSPDHAAEITVWPEAYVNYTNTYLDYQPQFTYNPNNSLDGQPSANSLLRVAYQGSTSSADPRRAASENVRAECKIEVPSISDTYYRNVYFALSGYVEQTSASGGHMVTQWVDFTINETNTAYVTSLTQGSEESYYDNLADAVSRVNTLNLSTTPKITLLRDFSSNVSPTITSGFVLELNGHNLHFSSTGYGMLCRQQDGLAKNITITLQNSGGSEKYVYGNFSDGVFVLGNSGNTYHATLSISSYVTVQNNGDGRGVTIHQDNKVDLSSTASKIVANGPGVFCAGGIVNCAGGTISSNGSYAIHSQVENNVASSLYFGGATQLQTSGNRQKINVAGASNTVTIYGKTMNNAAISNAASPITITYGTTPSINSVIVNNAGSYALSVFSVTNNSEFTRLVIEGTYLYYRYQTRTVSYNSNGGSGTMTSDSPDYNSSYTVKSCSFSAPAYHTFLRWNTSATDDGASYSPNNKMTITGNVTLYAIWFQSVTDQIDEFIGVKLHFDVDVIDKADESDTGACRGENGYYAIAKTAYNALTQSQKGMFCTNAAYADGRARFIAWANANGEDLNLTTYNIVEKASRVSISLDNVEENNTALCVVVIAITSVTVVAVLIALKKKRYSK